MIRTAKLLAVVAAAMIVPVSAHAQTARPADVGTVDGVIKAIYDVISGPAGQERDWNRFRSLFADGARLIPTGVDSAGTPRMRMMTPQQFVETNGPFFVQNGFFEREIGRTTDRFGNVLHVFSTYDSKRKADDPKPFARGINSFQLWWDGTRWWVLTIFWQGESPATPIPAKYLNK